MPRKTKAAADQSGHARKRPVQGVSPAAPNASDDGRAVYEIQCAVADSLATNTATNHTNDGIQIGSVSGGSSKASGIGHAVLDTPQRSAISLAPIIEEIRSWHRQRVFAMETRKRSDLSLGAFVRCNLGWSRQLPKAEADKIKKAAADLLALGEKIAAGKETGIGNTQWATYSPIILASIKGRSHWDAIEKNATKEMERLAVQLPVWSTFGEPIKGFGARSLAVIIAETGDLSLYANPAKVWKRMGLAVMNGVRQGGLRKNASKEEWIAHGYNAKRRSFMFVIGDVLVKNQNPYRDLYLARKEIERAKAAQCGLTVVPAAKIPAKRKDEFMSDGHVHRRAQRYMEKRLLKDLWQAWRQAVAQEQSTSALPAAQTEGQTKHGLKTKRMVSA